MYRKKQGAFIVRERKKCCVNIEEKKRTLSHILFALCVLWLLLLLLPFWPTAAFELISVKKLTIKQKKNEKKVKQIQNFRCCRDNTHTCECASVSTTNTHAAHCVTVTKRRQAAAGSQEQTPHSSSGRLICLNKLCTWITDNERRAKGVAWQLKLQLPPL